MKLFQLLSLSLGWAVTDAFQVMNPEDTIPVHDKRAAAASCTATSRNLTFMTLRKFYVFHSVPNIEHAHQRINLGIYNPATGDEYKFKNMPFIEDGDWHECVANPDPLPKQLVACKYVNDIVDTALGFQLHWVCNDGDSKKPILFNATMAGPLDGVQTDVKMPISKLVTNGTFT